MAILTYEPDSIVQGSTATWKKALPEFPADTYTLTYSFVNAGGQFSITATNLADGFHTVNVLPSVTTDYVPGEYKWQSYATLGVDRFDVARGTMTVKPDFATQTSLDARSDVQITFEALTAVLKGKATKDQLSYTIQGRSISRFTPSELILWHDKYRRLYNQELAAEGLQKGRGPENKVLVRFLNRV